jgi:hypothetical protein
LREYGVPESVWSVALNQAFIVELLRIPAGAPDHICEFFAIRETVLHLLGTVETFSFVRFNTNVAHEPLWRYWRVSPA